jgi:hypothetical protein
MRPSTVLALYIGVGLLTTSAMHTWYATQSHSELSFGLPFSTRFRISTKHVYGYLGAYVLFFLGMGATGYFFALIGGLESLAYEQLMGALVRFGVPGTVVLGGFSQVLGGSSWSKAILDGVVFFMGIVVAVSYVQQPTFWALFSVYGAMIPLLGAAWSAWRRYYIERRIVDEDEVVVAFPHFPSFTYFAVSGGYAIIVSLILILANVTAS